MNKLLGMLIVLVALISVIALISPGFDRGVHDDLPENIVYISLDAVSAEHVGCYGYERETMPNLCDLDNSTLYTNAYATSSWTLLSLASQQVGVYHHKANVIGPETPLDTDYYTIAEILDEEGYETILKNRNPHMNQQMNSDQGFNRFELDPRKETLPEDFGNAIEEDNVYFRAHFMASHTPYDPRDDWFQHEDYEFIDEVNETLTNITATQKPNLDSEPYNISASERREIINHYDENILATDKYIGRIIEELKDRDQYEESLIIINADHGEAFNNYEKNIWNHEAENPPISRVPMAIKYPNSGSNKTSDNLVSHLDPFKIVLNEVGRDLDYPIDAIDPREGTREKHFTYSSAGISVTNGTHFEFYDKRDNSYTNYMIDWPRAEITNKSYVDLRENIQRFQKDIDSRNYQKQGSFEKDEKLEKRLRELGYIN